MEGVGGAHLGDGQLARRLRRVRRLDSGDGVGLVRWGFLAGGRLVLTLLGLWGACRPARRSAPSLRGALIAELRVLDLIVHRVLPIRVVMSHTQAPAGPYT